MNGPAVRVALAAALVCVCAPSVAGVMPPPGRIDPRVRELEYRADEVIELTAYVGYHIHLQLGPEEQFVALGAGDSAAVDVAAEGPHVMLKPTAEQVATNLTLISSRRVYLFEYRASRAMPPPYAAVYSLRFRYPAPSPEVSAPVATPAPATSASAVVAAPLSVTPTIVNREYWYCGSPWLKPLSVEDDGAQTRLGFASRSEWPAIFVADEDGNESLANFHAEGTSAVVHRVARRFVLRRGGQVGCIENRGYAGSAAWRGAAGTAMPDGAAREGAPR